MSAEDKHINTNDIGQLPCWQLGIDSALFQRCNVALLLIQLSMQTLPPKLELSHSQPPLMFIVRIMRSAQISLERA